MRVDVVTIFPEYLDALRLSLIGRAREQGLLERLNGHPFTPWMLSSGILVRVGEKQSIMTTDYTWRLALDLSDPTRREAILGWLVACAGPSRASAIVELDYPDRGALDGWLEQIWRETTPARPSYHTTRLAETCREPPRVNSGAVSGVTFPVAGSIRYTRPSTLAQRWSRAQLRERTSRSAGSSATTFSSASGVTRWMRVAPSRLIP